MSTIREGQYIWGEPGEHRLLSVDSATGKVYKHYGFSTSIVDSFSSPDAAPTDIGWDETNLLSCDTTNNFIFQHVGFSSSLTDSISSPGAEVSGVAWDGTNLLSQDTGSPKLVYKHDGWSTSILDSFSLSSIQSGLTWDGFYPITAEDGGNNDLARWPPWAGERLIECFSSPSTAPSGCAWDGANLISCDKDVDDIYLHIGFTASLTDCFSSPSSVPEGVAWITGEYRESTEWHLLSIDPIGGVPLAFKHEGFSPTVVDQVTPFDSGADLFGGITWDGQNLYYSCYDDNDHVKVSGFADGLYVIDSFSAPGVNTRAQVWDGTNLLSTDYGTADIYRFTGFTSSIDECFSSPSTSPQAVAWDGTNVYSSDFVTTDVYKHVGFTDSITESFSAPGAVIFYGLDFWGTDLIACDSGTGSSGGLIYKQSGFSATVLDSFSSPAGNPADIAWAGFTIDGPIVRGGGTGYEWWQWKRPEGERAHLIKGTDYDVLHSDTSPDDIYRFVGFSNVIRECFSSLAGQPNDIAWDGLDMMSIDNPGAVFYIVKYTGFTPTVKESFSTPAGTGVGLYWDDAGYLLWAEQTANDIYRFNGFSNNIVECFSSPAALIYGVHWDGANLLSVDGGTFLFYKHDGFSTSIAESFSKSPAGAPYSLAWDGTNLLSCDGGTPDRIVKHSGFGPTITDSFSTPHPSPSVPFGLEVDRYSWGKLKDDAVSPVVEIYDEGGWIQAEDNVYGSGDTPVIQLRGSWESFGQTEGGNLLSSDAIANFIYKHVGFSPIILESFSSPDSQPTDVSWDGANLLSCDATSNDIYKHTGFSTSITECFSSPGGGPNGIAWDGTNLLSTDSTPDVIYRHVGFSAAYGTDCFSSPAASVAGVSWDGTNILSNDAVTNITYKHIGFSTSILESFSTTTGNIFGVHWDGANVINTNYAIAYIYKHDGFSASITECFSSPGAQPFGVSSDGPLWELYSDPIYRPGWKYVQTKLEAI